MSRVSLSRLAQADLKEIGRFIKQHNEAAAKKWVRKLRQTCKGTIGNFPGCGTQFDHLVPGMRGFSVGDYMIFFEAAILSPFCGSSTALGTSADSNSPNDRYSEARCRPAQLRVSPPTR